LAYRLTNETGYGKVVVSKVAVNRWLPGSVPVLTDEFLKNPPDLPPGDVVLISDAVLLPGNMPAATYDLAIAVVDSDEKPVVRLGIKGQGEDGWYRLSKVEVSK
jgi:hypothetical protein